MDQTAGVAPLSTANDTGFPTAVVPETLNAAAPQVAAAPATVGTPPPTDVTATVATTSGSGGGRRRRVIMIGIGVLLMLAGLATGTYLVTQRQLEPSFAWDCTTYKFEVDDTGAVVAQNGSLRDLPAQVAKVYIDDQMVAEFDVRALESGDSASLGVVPVPENGKFTWRVEGEKDCTSDGTFKPESVAQCLSVKAFDEDWEPLTISDLSAFDVGDVVRFTIGGITNKGTFEAARFTINGEVTEAVNSKRPTTDEFYYEYTLPRNIEKFNVTAELMHSEIGWIGK